MKTNQTFNADTNYLSISRVEPVVSLKDLIIEYKVIAIKLGFFADNVPDTDIEQKALMKEELRLLDRQAEILETVLSNPIETLDDAKAVLTLWHYEVIQSQSMDSLSAADGLVNSVYEFLTEV